MPTFLPREDIHSFRPSGSENNFPSKSSMLVIDNFVQGLLSQLCSFCKGEKAVIDD